MPLTAKEAAFNNRFSNDLSVILFFQPSQKTQQHSNADLETPPGFVYFGPGCEWDSTA